MIRTTRRVALALVLATFALPASAQSRWLKGNLHTHTLWSDGNDFPEMVTAAYMARGYDFLALSDHNILSQGEKWMPRREIVRRGGAIALKEYIDHFGEDWVETRGEGDEIEVRLKTLDEVRSKLQRAGVFLLIQSEEISDSHEGKPIHLNATNIQELIEPQRGDSIRDTIRNNLLAIAEQAERTGEPILGHVNHPNYGWAITAEDLAHVLEDRFFEVFNGHPDVNTFGSRERPSTEQMWDIANTIRIAELDAPPLYGLATDDSHNYHSESGSISFRGWVMVRAEKLDAAAIIEALRGGDFYASTGVTLRDVRYDGDVGTLTIEIEPAENATYTTTFIGTRAGGDADDPEIGQVLEEVEGPIATYRCRGDELYVRATITSSRPVEFPVVPGQRRQAWTQPVGWR